MIRHVSWYVSAVLILLVGNTLAAQGLPRIHDAERFYPDYQSAYREAVECTGTKYPRPYEDIVWMRVPRPNFTDDRQPEDEGKLPNIGEWVAPDTIYIAAPWTDSWVPKHEIIHY